MLIVGLGNVGAQYAKTRHNIGFAAVDALVERSGGSRYWKSEAGCLVTELRVAGEQVLVAKPQDFMNTSGGPVSKLVRARHIKPAELLVVHDEVDLPAGEVRSRFGGGLNAHNGLRSIKNKLGTDEFGRVRCGIGRPPGKMQVADYVLRELKGAQLEEFELLAQAAADVIEEVVAHGYR